MTIDIPPAEVQAFLDARHKRQKDRFIELNYEVTAAFKRWMCCPKSRSRHKLSRHWQNCYMTYYSLCRKNATTSERNCMQEQWRSSPSLCEVGDWCFGPPTINAIAIVAIKPKVSYHFVPLLWKSDSCTYELPVWRRIK